VFDTKSTKARGLCETGSCGISRGKQFRIISEQGFIFETVWGDPSRIRLCFSEVIVWQVYCVTHCVVLRTELYYDACVVLHVTHCCVS